MILNNLRHKIIIFALQANETMVKKRENAKRVKEFIASMRQEHEDTYDENNIRDFIDLFIQISRKDEEDVRDVFTSISIQNVAFFIFISGMYTFSRETTVKIALHLFRKVVNYERKKNIAATGSIYWTDLKKKIRPLK